MALAQRQFLQRVSIDPLIPLLSAISAHNPPSYFRCHRALVLIGVEVYEFQLVAFTYIHYILYLLLVTIHCYIIMTLLCVTHSLV